MNDYPQHCTICGAYLATDTDQTKHGEWHATITLTLSGLLELAHRASETAEHADAFHRLYKGKPA